MQRIVLFFATLALVGLTTTGAFAQASSKDYRKDCDSAFFKRAAYTYLTGKRVKPNWDSMFTKGRNQLKINGGSLTALLSRDRTDYTVHAGVTLPFTAIKSYAKLLYTPVKNHSKSELTVCHYALKSSAESWGSFQMSDLSALFGRHLTGITGTRTVSVRMGRRRPPRGYRASTVAVAFVTHFNDRTPTVKLRLVSSRR